MNASHHAALELRVLEGPQAGARAPLPLAGAVVLAVTPDGLADGADLVLRDEQSPPIRLRVQAGLPLATLQVMQGEVLLGERRLAAGDEIDWTMHVPLKAGRAVIAFGAAASARWNPPSAAAGAEPAAAAPAEATPQAATPGRRAQPLARRPEVWLAGAGAAVLLLCGIALGVPMVAAEPRTPPVAEAVTLGELIQGSEFAALAVGQAGDGRATLGGRLATQAERVRLDAWLARHGMKPRLDIRVDELLAMEVSEVFRVNGIAVQARTTSPGKVTAEAAEPDAAKLARAEEVVRRDVRGLTELVLRNTAPAPAAPPRPALPEDPAKRIASVVPGQPSYLVTADGARYFVGALLPSGHRITAIAQARVTLERDGRTSTLNF